MDAASSITSKLPSAVLECLQPKGSPIDFGCEQLNFSVIGNALRRQVCAISAAYERGDIPVCLLHCRVALDIVWEKLHTGYWKDVDLTWRHLYYSVSCALALAQCAANGSTGHSPDQPAVSPDQLAVAIKTCDMGLLMGTPHGACSVDARALVTALHSLVVTTARRHFQDGMQAVAQPPQPEESAKLFGHCVDSTRTAPVLTCPSVETFYREYVLTECPLVIRGAIDYWPALSSRTWSLDYLSTVAGRRTVPVELGSRYTDEAWTQSLMTIDDFIRKHVVPQRSSSGEGEVCGATTELPVGYLAQHQLFDQVPELRADISVPTYCCVGAEDEVDINAWFGPGGTVSPLHFDPKHNFLCQVVGSKYVRLYRASESPRLYAHDEPLLFNTSRVDVEAPDSSRFPLFAEAQYVEAVLGPGDMLYIPPGCWHFVRSLSLSFSVSFWWQ